MYDLIVKGGLVYDGTGAPPRQMDIAIKGSRVVTTGLWISTPAIRVLDARRTIVTPGFVDIHTHYDLCLGWDGLSDHCLRQGVTTVVGGNCGLGEANAGAVLERAERARLGVHFGTLAPLGPLRCKVVPRNEARMATIAELPSLLAVAARVLDAGALGLSWGPYHANTKMDVEELRCLLSVAASRGKPCCIHRRSEGPGCLEATQEAISLGRDSGARVQISHLKVAGRANWPVFESMLQSLHAARSEVDLAVDVYPFDASLTYLSALIPDELKAAGTIHRELATESGRWAARRGVQEAFANRAAPDDIILLEPSNRLVPPSSSLTSATRFMYLQDPVDAVLELINADPNGTGGWTVYGGMMSSEHVETISGLSYAAIASDALPVESGGGVCAHPRCYATFAQALTRANKRGAAAFADVIRRSTSFPAERMNLDRGRIEPGAHADIVVMGNIQDVSSYQSPARYPKGIEHVVVAGQVALFHGEPTGVRAGEVLRR